VSEAQVISLLDLLDRLQAGGNPTYERRNARAKARGWGSYAVERFWLPQFGARRRRDGSLEVVDEVRQAATARALGRAICPEGPERDRGGSYWCRACERRVNGPGALVWAARGTPRRGEWQARLVQAAGGGARAALRIPL
jgi:hypothetical protein